MKKSIIAAVLAVASFSALAACPWPTKWMCYQGQNGKVICGCN